MSLGGPALGMAVDVFDDAGKPLRGAVGELVCTRPWPGMTRGLYKDDARYLETYFGRWPNVWVHGDWASIDADGNWFLHGRSDDTIKIAGKRLGPAEVESALVSHPAVVEAAAIGVPDEMKGEALWVFVVLSAESRRRPRGCATELVALVAERLGSSFRPSAVRFTKRAPEDAQRQGPAARHPRGGARQTAGGSVVARGSGVARSDSRGEVIRRRDASERLVEGRARFAARSFRALGGSRRRSSRPLLRRRRRSPRRDLRRIRRSSTRPTCEGASSPAPRASGSEALRAWPRSSIRARLEAKAVVAVDAGDFLPGAGDDAPQDEVERRTKVVFAAYKRVGVAVVTPGERELSLGVERLRTLLKAANVRAVAANVIAKKGEVAFDDDPIVETGGITVGVFGVFEPPPEFAATLERAGLTTTDAAEAARDKVRALREKGARIVVGLFHVAGGAARARQIAAEAGDVDVVVLGHGLNDIAPADFSAGTAARIVYAGPRARAPDASTYERPTAARRSSKIARSHSRQASPTTSASDSFRRSTANARASRKRRRPRPSGARRGRKSPRCSRPGRTRATRPARCATSPPWPSGRPPITPRPWPR